MVHQRLIFQIFTFSIISSVALLGYGLQNFFEEPRKISELAPFVILTPMAIIVPCAFMINAMREDIFRWGAYIIVFHESDTEPGYEMRLNKIRDMTNPLKESYTSIVWVYLVLCFACSGLFAWGVLMAPFHWSWSLLAIIPLGSLIWATVRFCKIPSKGNREKLLREWRKAEGAC